jgi:F-type H+-transporting ATPase subunit delta
MAGTRAAIRYARAIIDQANDRNATEMVQEDMKLIASTVASNQELEQFISNPTLNVEAKNNALVEIFASTNAVTKSLFRLLLENKRFELLHDIAVEFSKLYDESKGIQHAEVTTAFTMDQALEEKVMAKIRTFSDKKIIINNIVDPAIIGGFIIRIGDQQFNASIANSLQTLKRELSN